MYLHVIDVVLGAEKVLTMLTGRSEEGLEQSEMCEGQELDLTSRRHGNLMEIPSPQSLSTERRHGEHPRCHGRRKHGAPLAARSEVTSGRKASWHLESSSVQVRGCAELPLHGHCEVGVPEAKL